MSDTTRREFGKQLLALSRHPEIETHGKKPGDCTTRCQCQHLDDTPPYLPHFVR